MAMPVIAVAAQTQDSRVLFLERIWTYSPKPIFISAFATLGFECPAWRTWRQ
jgi:hypothetical protein